MSETPADGVDGENQNEIVWEFECSCGEELELPTSETDFSPTKLGLPECSECGEYMIHVGPVLDECDKCHRPLLYSGNSIRAFGLESVCDGCYDRIAEVI